MKIKLGYRHLLFLGFLINIVLTTSAQDVRIKASAPSTVAVGQQFRLQYNSNTEITNLKLPAMKDFTILGGPYQSKSSSIQIINGRSTSSSSCTYTYEIQADKQGDFTIPGANVSVKGKTYKSNSLNIKVIAEENNASSAAYPKQNSQNQSSRFDKSDYFVRAEVSKTKPYVEEEVIVNYKLYIGPQAQRYQANISKLPSSAGFWSYDLGDRNEEKRPHKENYNGKTYSVIDLYSIAVYPQKSGKLTIAPLEVDLIVQIITQPQSTGDPFFDMFNSFGGGNIQNIPIKVSSKPLFIQARELPKLGRPENFSGLVGNFTIQSSLSRDKLKANEASNLILHISGKGNLQHVDVPIISFPSDIESHEPTISDRISRAEKAGISGSRSFEYVLIPREAGEYEIPSVSFSYFDANKGKYVSINTKSFNLKVSKGDKVTAVADSKFSNKKDVKELGTDIRFIHNTANIQNGNETFFMSLLYVILLVLPLVLFILLVILLRKRIADRKNEVLLKDKKASKLARKRLKMSEKYMKDHKDIQFYEEISRVLWGYVSDKFHLPIGQLSMETARQKLSERNMNSQRIDEFLETLNQCEYVRFAPSSDITPEKMYEKTFAFIINIEQELKSL